jgi:hypothetical protein
MQAMRASDSTWCRRGFDWQPETLGLDKNDENQSKKAKNKAMHMWASDSTWCRCGFDLARLKTRPWGASDSTCTASVGRCGFDMARLKTRPRQ